MLLHTFSPNDGGSTRFCLCEVCRRLDLSNTPEITLNLGNKHRADRGEDSRQDDLKDWEGVALTVASHSQYRQLQVLTDCFTDNNLDQLQRLDEPISAIKQRL